MTDTQLPTDEQIAEIEARHELAAGAFHPYAETEKSLADIPALCATVKQLRAEKREHERLLELANKYSVEAGEAIRNLQSQLEQLRAENERLKQQATQSREKFYRDDDAEWWRQFEL